jgi:SAM-dependent methyltransferase
MIDPNREREALAWQTGVWNRISNIYLREIDRRFAPVVEAMVGRAALRNGEQILDLGTGTGAVAQRAAAIVGPGGNVVGVDISPEMLALARRSAAGLGLGNLTFLEGRAEAIPAEDAAFDVALACLSMMYVIDREAAARQIARVLKPFGRFIAAVWAGPEQCDIVLFQQTAGRFAGPPPVPGVGPGALADPSDFLRQLDAAGIRARVETQTLGFDFPDFTSAWDTLAGVTTAQLHPERQQEAKDAVMTTMYASGDEPRHFRNMTQFIVGRATGNAHAHALCRRLPNKARWSRLPTTFVPALLGGGDQRQGVNRVIELISPSTQSYKTRLWRRTNQSHHTRLLRRSVQS